MSITPLSRAATLPSRFYLDPGLQEEEKVRVFGATWQLVARAEELQLAPLSRSSPVGLSAVPNSHEATAWLVTGRQIGQIHMRRPRDTCSGAKFTPDVNLAASASG